MIARMLLTMYSGDYTKSNASEVLGKMLRNASTQNASTIPILFEGCSDPYVDTYAVSTDQAQLASHRLSIRTELIET